MWKRNDWWKLQKWSWQRRLVFSSQGEVKVSFLQLTVLFQDKFSVPRRKRGPKISVKFVKKLNEEKGHHIKLSLIKTEVGA